MDWSPEILAMKDEVRQELRDWMARRVVVGYNAHASRLAEAERVIDHYARKATWNEAPVVALIPSGTAYGGDELKGYDKAREYRRKYPADETAKGEE